LSISFGSIGTGLPKDIVDQLIKAEKIPIDKMESRKGKIENKKKLLSELTTSVENMRGEIFKSRGFRSFRELKVDAESDAVKVTLDKNLANTGTWQLEVVQLAQKSSIFSNGVEDKDNTYLGVGYISYELPNGEEREVYVSAEDSSLTGIAKLINNDSENGMRANVVNDGKDKDKPWRLVISLENSGDLNKAQWPYFYMVDGVEDLYIDEKRDGRDAKIKVDGFEVEVPENKLKELIPGAIIDLKKAKPGEEFSIQITEDTQKITEKMTSIVDRINDVLKFIKMQNAMDEKTDSSQTLGGDASLRTLESKIRNTVFQPIQTSKGPRRIGELGITFGKDGLLAFDTTKFEKAVSEDYKSAAEVVVGIYSREGGKTNGFIDNVYDLTGTTLEKPYGLLTNKKSGLQSGIDQIDRQIDTKKRMIEQKERVLKDKFARLEETMSRIKGQGAGLAGLGAQQPGVQQLG
jgi:flagellar hook-associated protein 2